MTVRIGDLIGDRGILGGKGSDLIVLVVVLDSLRTLCCGFDFADRYHGGFYPEGTTGLSPGF